MVLVFAFLGSQLVLEHTLACLAINGGNQMHGQGGVDMVGIMSSYAGCREISELFSSLSPKSYSSFLQVAGARVCSSDRIHASGGRAQH